MFLDSLLDILQGRVLLFIIRTLKQSDDLMVVWKCFSASGVDLLQGIEGHNDQFIYRVTLNNLLPHTENQDNPKHKSKIVMVQRSNYQYFALADVISKYQPTL